MAMATPRESAPPVCPANGQLLVAGGMNSSGALTGKQRRAQRLIRVKSNGRPRATSTPQHYGHTARHRCQQSGARRSGNSGLPSNISAGAELYVRRKGQIWTALRQATSTPHALITHGDRTTQRSRSARRGPRKGYASTKQVPWARSYSQRPGGWTAKQTRSLNTASRQKRGRRPCFTKRRRSGRGRT